MSSFVEEIRLDETPKSLSWRYIPIYKKAANDADIFWQIGFDGVNMIQIDYGYVNGVITHMKTEIVLNNSGRTMLQQSQLEIRHRYIQKYQEGYRPAGCTEKVFQKGMKGHPYKPTMKLKKRLL